MKEEQQTLMVSAIINVFVSFFKILGGIFCGSYTLIATGYYTICDFVTDIIAMIGAKVGKKRANKKHPFGYGKIEYSLHLAVGVVIIIVGLFVGIKSFFLKFNVPDFMVIYILIFAFLLKVLSSNYLLQKGKDISSLILMTNAKESYIDIISIIITFLVLIISRFVPLIDLIGCLLMSLLIAFDGIKIVFDNIIVIVGIDDNDPKIKKKIKKIIDKMESIEYSDSFLIKNGAIYQATIQIGVDENISLNELIKLERKIKKQVKNLGENIRYIDFNIIKK